MGLIELHVATRDHYLRYIEWEKRKYHDRHARKNAMDSDRGTGATARESKVRGEFDSPMADRTRARPRHERTAQSPDGWTEAGFPRPESTQRPTRQRNEATGVSTNQITDDHAIPPC